MPRQAATTVRPAPGRLPAEALAKAGAWQQWLVVAIVFAALTTIVTWPQVPRVMTHAPAHTDALFNMWRLSWITEALTTAPARLFDPPIFHPATRVLAFSDAVLLQGVLAAPFLAAGAPVLPVANIVLLLGPWMSALGAYLLARDLLRDPAAGNPRGGVHWPALVAGTVFGFLPYRVEHVMHLELQWSQWMPLACWALHRTVQWGRVRDGVLTAVFVLAQFLSCIYYGVFLVLALAVSAPFLLLGRAATAGPTSNQLPGAPDESAGVSDEFVGVSDEFVGVDLQVDTTPTAHRAARAPLGAIARALVVGALVTLGPLIAYSAPYRANQATLGSRSAHDIARWSATPIGFLSAPPENRLYGASAALSTSEGRLFPGVTALLLAGLGLWTLRRRPAVAMYAVMTTASALMALGSNTPIYRAALIVLPPLAGLRAPARFGMVVALGLAVLAAAGAAALLARVADTRRRHAIGAVLVLALAMEYASNVAPLQAWTQRTPLYAQWLGQQPPGVVVDLPIARAGALPHHEAEWAFYGRTHGHPMVNGYSGYFPKPYLDLLGAMIAFPRGASLEALRRVETRYIVVHEDRYAPADLADFDARLRGTPGIRFLARIPDPDYPASIYTLEPALTDTSGRAGRPLPAR